MIDYYYERDNETDKNNENEARKKIEKLSLDKVIIDKFLNFIYLIDIDIVVFFAHWGSYIFYMKGIYFGKSFISHIYWSFFIKFYFSFLIICNSTILYIFYESETFVKLNLFNLILYFFIAFGFIFFLSIILYISVELPLKKLFKYLFSKEYKNYLINKIRYNFEKKEEDYNNEDEDKSSSSESESNSNSDNDDMDDDEDYDERFYNDDNYYNNEILEDDDNNSKEILENN